MTWKQPEGALPLKRFTEADTTLERPSERVA